MPTAGKRTVTRKAVSLLFLLNLLGAAVSAVSGALAAGRRAWTC
jgi:uncharacterized membrane protein YeiH